MAEHYEHGKMDISVQEKTLAGFLKWVTRAAIVCICALIFMALVNG